MKAHTKVVTPQPQSPGRHMMDGLIRVLIAQALLPLTGFITSIFLSRRLGPANYGLFTLSALLVFWIQSTLTSMFSRTTVKFVAEAEDWRPIGSKIIRLYLLTSSGLMVLLWLLAEPIAKLFDEVTMVGYLRLIALDLPLFAVAWGHKDILNGLGRYRPLASTRAIRLIARLLLIILFVELGFSVRGAIIGLIGASVVDLAISRYYVRPSLFRASTFPIRLLLGYSVPLFLSALCLRIFRLDLFALKALGGTAAEAGFYGAAVNLVMMLYLIGGSISGLLLSTLTRVLRDGDANSGKTIARNALRGIILILPIAGMTAGTANEIVSLIYGAKFLTTGPLLAILVFSAIAQVMILATHAILVAGGKPRWTLALAGPMVPLALVGHLLLIPRMGATGTALVTTVVAGAGAVASVLAVYRMWTIYPPVTTLIRGILICGLAYIIAIIWPAAGFWVLPKLIAITLFIPLAFLVSCEFSADEISWVRALLPRLRTKRR